MEKVITKSGQEPNLCAIGEAFYNFLDLPGVPGGVLSYADAGPWRGGAGGRAWRRKAWALSWWSRSRSSW